jgi:hypothetical protein
MDAIEYMEKMSSHNLVGFWLLINMTITSS